MGHAPNKGGPRTSKSLSGLAALTIGLIAGIGVTARRKDGIREAMTSVAAVPDFVLALLLQIAVVAFYRWTGFRIARVASLTTSEPALVLPLVTLTLVPAISVLRVVSARAHLAVAEDHTLVAMALGLSRRRIYLTRITPIVLDFVRADVRPAPHPAAAARRSAAHAGARNGARACAPWSARDLRPLLRRHGAHLRPGDVLDGDPRVCRDGGTGPECDPGIPVDGATLRVGRPEPHARAERFAITPPATPRATTSRAQDCQGVRSSSRGRPPSGSPAATEC